MQIGQATLFHCSALLSATSFSPIHQTTDAQWSHPPWKPWSKYPSLPFWVVEENVPAERSRILIKTKNIEHMLKLLEEIFLPLCGNSVFILKVKIKQKKVPSFSNSIVTFSWFKWHTSYRIKHQMMSMMQVNEFEKIVFPINLPALKLSFGKLLGDTIISMLPIG